MPMVAKIDLEVKIYLILSDEKGHTHGEIGRILGLDKGNLSKKMTELREKRKTIYRVSQTMDYPRWPHYITKDLEVFKYILKKLAKHLKSAVPELGPGEFYIIPEGYFFDDLFSDAGRFICHSIGKFIRSEYTMNILEEYGFEQTYIIFKEITHGYCGITMYVELAEDLIKRGKITREDLGKSFLADREEKTEPSDTGFRK